MSKELNYRADHYCPVYGKVITPDLCYDTLVCLNGSIKIETNDELSRVVDIETAKKRCRNCPYSKL